jgi:predicted DNA binding CopG/RHH family protein
MSNPIPELNNEDPSTSLRASEEREFWADQNSSEILDWKKAQHAIFPNLKPTLKFISLRLPESIIDKLRQLANERDIPYQSLIKHFLRERIDQEYQVKKP